MKLLYIHQYFCFPDSGSGTRSYDLATSFLKKGIDVTIISSSTSNNIKNKKRWSYVEREGLKLWILRNDYSSNMSFFRRIYSFFRFMFFSSLKILRMKADVVLATSTPLTVAVPAIVKKITSNTPFIFEVRDVWPEVPIKLGYIKNRFAKSFLIWLEKYTYNKASYVVPLSVGMQSNILSRIHVKNIMTIPNISELERFKNVNECPLDYNFEGKKTVVYAGSLGRVNGLMYLAKLAEATFDIDPDICYLVVGNGYEKEKIMTYCKNHGILNKNIFFHKPIKKNDLPFLYSKASMGSSFVTNDPILWDNSANKFFDTLAAGKPILINHGGWQADVIRKKRCGIVLSPNLTSEDIKSFVAFVRDDQAMDTAGRNALSQAEEYSLPVAVDKYMQIFKSMRLIK